MRARREGKKSEDAQIRRIAEVQGRCSEDHERLQEIGGEEPGSRATVDEVGDLASDVDTDEEEAQADGDVGEDEHGVGHVSEDGSQSEEDGVAGLVGCEAVVGRK